MDYELVTYFTVKDDRPYVAVDYLYADGRRVFQTHHELPIVENEKEGFKLMSEIAEWLGNSLLISTPEFRQHIGIEEGDD
ncbi:MAG: hypothetical protein GY951_15055 [Psychromonas sp.]|nr:hypothetical protein [Psychromonas sp.]